MLFGLWLLVLGLGLGISIPVIWSPWVCPFIDIFLFVCWFFFARKLRKFMRKLKFAAAKTSDHRVLQTQSIDEGNDVNISQYLQLKKLRKSKQCKQE